VLDDECSSSSQKTANERAAGCATGVPDAIVPLKPGAGAELLVVYLNPGSSQKTAKEVFKLCLRESKKTSPTYNISETAINELSYQLLEEKKLQDALVFFKLNIELYPKSSNVYDGYGECLLALGKEKEGLAAYKKSLDLNPNNSNAFNVLKKHNQK